MCTFIGRGGRGKASAYADYYCSNTRSATSSFCRRVKCKTTNKQIKETHLALFGFLYIGRKVIFWNQKSNVQTIYRHAWQNISNWAIGGPSKCCHTNKYSTIGGEENATQINIQWEKEGKGLLCLILPILSVGNMLTGHLSEEIIENGKYFPSNTNCIWAVFQIVFEYFFAYKYTKSK